MIKNLETSKILEFADQVTYLPGQVVSKTLAQNSAMTMTLFAFDKGEEISTHESKGDALIIVLDGKGKVIIDDVPYELSNGQSILMPAKHPHSVSAPDERFKMLLIVVFPKEVLTIS